MIKKIIKIIAITLSMSAFFNDSLIGMLEEDLLCKDAETCKKYNLSICATFTNEAKYLNEWIEYHLAFGVDHFYLYNIESKDSYIAALNPYIKKEIVTLVNWPEISKREDHNNWILNTQIPAYENALNFVAKNETKWLVFVNVDEFLLCANGNIKDLLSQYESCSGLSLSLNTIDETVWEKISQKNISIHSLESFSPSSELVEETSEKLIFKPDHCIGFTWPPYQCRFKSSLSKVKIDRQKLCILHCVNRTCDYSIFEKKIERGDGVDYRILSETDTLYLLEKGYVIEDQERPLYYQIPELLQKMQQKILGY